jgi:hypothetical protein
VPPDKVPPGANVFDQFDSPPPKWALDYVRATYPQYNDLSDEELAGRLHRKYHGPAWKRAPLVCDANELASISDLPPLPAGFKLDQPQLDGNVNLNDTGKLIGIQAKILDVSRAVRSSRSWPLPIALALFGLSAMPWLWYALLRRIGELRAAIGGNPPEP